MSENSYTEITKNSYGKNVKNSFGGIIFGIVLFVLSVVILWFNEGNLAKQNQIASYVNKNAIPVQNTPIDTNNDNKLISVSGNLVTDEDLSDGLITAPKALVLDRTVEMYQWVEHEDSDTDTNMGGSTTTKTTYTYKKEWSDRPIDSSNFYKKSYVNPPFTLKSERLEAKKGSFGEFKLSNYQTSRLNNLSEYSNLPYNRNYTISGNYYYKSNNIESPSIGDIRISYKYTPSDSPVSVIGMQRADKTITPMTIKQGNVYMQYDGILTQDEIVEKFKKGNLVTTNIFRIIGFFLMFFGLNLILKPIGTLLSFIPIFEKIVSFLTGGLVFLISLVLSLIIIAVAWLCYRPVAAICLLAAAVAVGVLIRNKISKNHIDS